MEPKVSVVIPVHDRLAALQTCLAGLRRQDLYEQLEVIVVDDASTQDSIRILAVQSGAEYMRIGHRCGAAFAKNTGLAGARGEFVLFLDSDISFLHDRTLTAMLALFAHAPDAGTIGGEGILDRDGILTCVFGRNWDLATGQSHCDYAHLNEGAGGKAVRYDYVPTSNCMVRARLARELRGFDDAYPDLGSDKDFGYRLGKLGFTSQVSAETVVLHHFSPAGRRGSGLFNQYRTQIRFYWRHFGLPAACRMVVHQTMNHALQGIAAHGRPEADHEAIARFESGFSANVLKLKRHQRGIGSHAQSLACSCLFVLAFLWCVGHRKGLHASGSYYMGEKLGSMSVSG